MVRGESVEPRGDRQDVKGGRLPLRLCFWTCEPAEVREGDDVVLGSAFVERRQEFGLSLEDVEDVTRNEDHRVRHLSGRRLRRLDANRGVACESHLSALEPAAHAATKRKSSGRCV